MEEKLLRHAIRIGNLNTLDDLHLIAAKKPLVLPPAEKVLMVNVPGKNGMTDLSWAQTGWPVFYEREGSWDFYTQADEARVWQAYRDIQTRLAQTCRTPVRVVLEDEPSFAYIGRVWASTAPQQAKQMTKVTLRYRFFPFKELAKPLEEDWLWDEFGFETDLAPQKLGDLRLEMEEPRRDIRLPQTDRPTRLTLTATKGAVSWCLRRNNPEGEKLNEGNLAAGETKSVLMEPASSVNGGYISIFCLTLTRTSENGAVVQASYHPGYL